MARRKVAALVVADDATAVAGARSAAEHLDGRDVVVCGAASEQVRAALGEEGVAVPAVDPSELDDVLRDTYVVVLDRAALLPSWPAGVAGLGGPASIVRLGAIELDLRAKVRALSFAATRDAQPPAAAFVAPVEVLGRDLANDFRASRLLTQRLHEAFGTKPEAERRNDLSVVVAPSGRVPRVPVPAAARDALPQSVTVVVPAHNAASTIRETVAAIDGQELTAAFAIVVVDDGSTDDTAAVVGELGTEHELRFVRRSTAGGPSAARNAGADAADSELLVFCDADDVPAAGFLAALVDEARRADIVSPIFDPLTDDGSPPTVREIASDPTARAAGEALARVTGNCAIWKPVFDAVGSWNEQLRMAEDYDLAWRAQLAGYAVGVAPLARMGYRIRGDRSTELAQVRSYAASRVRLHKLYRDSGVSQWEARRALKRWGWLARHTPTLVRAGAPRDKWLRAASGAVGRVQGSIRERVLYF